MKTNKLIEKTKGYFIKSFTLIELIVVIVVIGILAAIVVPNISSFKEEAKETAIHSNGRHLQTAIDMYQLDNHGTLPSGEEQPELGKPQMLDFSNLHPDHIRHLPKIAGMYYWVDYQGKLYYSTVDSPLNVSNNGEKVTWSSIEGAEEYRVYEVSGEGATGRAKKTGLILVDSLDGATETLPNNFVSTKLYAISSVDKNGYESAPVIRGYAGYPKPVLETDGIPVLNPNTSGNTNSNYKVNGVMSYQDDYLYYSLYQKGVYRIKSDLTESTKISEDGAQHINVIGEWIYYISTDTSRYVWKMKLDGSEKQVVIEKTSSNLQIHNGFLYFISGSTFNRAKLDGTEEEVFPRTNINYFYFDNGKIFFTVGNMGQRSGSMNIDGTNVEYYGYNSSINDYIQFYSFEVKNGFTYYISNYATSYTISKVPTKLSVNNASITRLISTKTFKFFLEEDHIIYENFSSNQDLYMVEINGNTPTKLLNKSTYTTLMGSKGDWLYVFDNSNGTIKRINYKTQVLEEKAQ